VRNRLTVPALAVLTALAAAACRRAEAPEETGDLAPGTTLEAPAPSSGVVKSPLAQPPDGFTNEMQADNLRRQAAALGISRLGKTETAAEQESAEEPPQPLTHEESLARLRHYSQGFASQRRALDRDKTKSVPLAGKTPRLMPRVDAGAPLDAGPKDPQAP
jgi:hypothetical protein